MLSHGRAGTRGLVAWRAGRPVGPDIRGACLRIVGSSGGWISGSNGVFTFIIS